MHIQVLNSVTVMGLGLRLKLRHMGCPTRCNLMCEKVLNKIIPNRSLVWLTYRLTVFIREIIKYELGCLYDLVGMQNSILNKTSIICKLPIKANSSFNKSGLIIKGNWPINWEYVKKNSIDKIGKEEQAKHNCLSNLG